MAGNSKNVLPPTTISSAVTLGTSYNSPPVSALWLDNFTFQINTTAGTPTGTYIVQGSNDYSQSSTGTVLNAGNWTTETSNLLGSQPAGGTGTCALKVTSSSWAWLRVNYAGTTGTASIVVSAKAV